jgi:predicted transcriptional regulator
MGHERQIIPSDLIRHRARREAQLESWTNYDLFQVEVLSGLGLTISEIATVIGISKRTMERRLADSPEFAIARTRGKAFANLKIARRAYDLAINGSVPMIKFWLTTQARWIER